MIDIMFFCENCGARIDEDSRFCENCGVLIEKNPEREEEQPVTELDQLMGMEPDENSCGFESDADKTMVFVKQDVPFQETQKFEFDLHQEQPEESLVPEQEEPQEADCMEQGEPQEPDCMEQEDPSPELEVPEVFLQNKGPIFNTQELKELREDLETQEMPQTPPVPESGCIWTEAEEETKPLFCMACGKQLPAGAAFCDACGTPTGEVAPSEIHRRRNGQSVIPGLVKRFFAKPADTIKKVASEDSFTAGIVFFLVKDVILAVLAAVFMGKLTASLGVFGTWLIGGDSFGFGAKIFLCALVMDALWIGILYGMSIVFKMTGSVKTLTGACGTAGLITAALLIITVLITAFAPGACICAILVTAGTGLLYMVKAAEAAFEADENRMLYMIAAAAAVYVIVIYAVLKLMV